MPDAPGLPPGKAFFMGRDLLATLRAVAARPEVVMDPVQFSHRDAGGRRHYRLRPQPPGGADGGAVLPPLHPLLTATDSGGLRAMVTEGSVIESLPKEGDGVAEHPVTGIWDIPGVRLKQYPVVDGQAVGVYFEVNERGYVKSAPAPIVQVRSEDPSEWDSSHFQPPVGPSEGSPGGVYVVLGVVRAPDGTPPRMEIHGAGNVWHYHDTPPFQMLPGAQGKDIFERYNLATGTYEYRGLKGESPILVERPAEGEDIVFRLDPESGFGSGGADAVVYLAVRYYSEVTVGGIEHIMQMGSAYETRYMKFDAGKLTETGWDEPEGGHPEGYEELRFIVFADL